MQADLGNPSEKMDTITLPGDSCFTQAEAQKLVQGINKTGLAKVTEGMCRAECPEQLAC